MELTKLEIRDAINFFLDELIIRGYKEITITIYANILDKFSEFLISEYKGIKYVDEINEKHIYMFRNSLRKADNFTQSLIDRAISCLRTFYKILTKMHLIVKDAIMLIKHTRESKKNLPKYLETEEMEEITASINTENNSIQNMEKVLFTLSSETGSTRSTILNLRWNDVDFDKGLIRLDSNNPRKSRTLKMSENLFNVLKNYKEETVPLYDAYILQSQNNSQLSPSRFTTLYKRIVKQWEELKFKMINDSKLSESEKKKQLSDARITSTVIRNSFIKFLLNNNLDIVLVKNCVGLLDYKSIHRFR